MEAIVLWAAISGVLFLTFLFLLVFGLIKKKKWTIIFSFFVFFLFTCSTAWTGYTVASKTYRRVSNALKPRTGHEIYSALFGNPQYGCMRVTNEQDQTIPKIDYAIWLEFKTCPEELKRILSLHNFTAKKEATLGWNTQEPSSEDSWFKPETLGDTVLVFKYQKDEYGNGQTIYSNMDSTKAYCIDVLD